MVVRMHPSTRDLDNPNSITSSAPSPISEYNSQNPTSTSKAGILKGSSHPSNSSLQRNSNLKMKEMDQDLRGQEGKAFDGPNVLSLNSSQEEKVLSIRSSQEAMNQSSSQVPNQVEESQDEKGLDWNLESLLELPDDTDDVDMTHSRIQSILELKLERFTKLKVQYQFQSKEREGDESLCQVNEPNHEGTNKSKWP